MRIYAPVIAALIVAGCTPQVPDSPAGIGFDSVETYQQQREAELAGGGTIELGASISDEVVAEVTPEVVAEGVEEPTVVASDAEPVQPNRDNPAISDEQNFDAVSSRETIESDAARRASQQQAYQVIAPTDLPTRPRGSGPNIVDFALSTTHLVGQSVYRRSGFGSGNRFRRNCAKYASPDLAQRAFLQKGGPEHDRQGIDPDGDGFACFWDPRPFRQAVQN